jgi:integrase/recombinase XerD
MKLQEAIEEFLFHCNFEKKLSTKTQSAYQTDLRQFKAFVTSATQGVLISEITKHELKQYLVSISLLKPKSIKRKIATLKAMFNFLEFEDKISLNPFRKMCIQIKEEKRLPTVMTLQEISLLLQKAPAPQSPPCATYFV